MKNLLIVLIISLASLQAFGQKYAGGRGDGSASASTSVFMVGEDRVGQTQTGLVKVYPNPASPGKYIYIDQNSEQKFDYVEISDVSGRFLNQVKIEKRRFQLPKGLKSGIYILSFTGPDSHELNTRISVRE